MFIAIDIGNTHTVVGVYEKEQLRVDWRLTSTIQRTADEIGNQLRGLMAGAGFDSAPIDGVGIASVVPSQTDIYAGMARKYFNVSPLVIDAELDLGLTIRYENPKSVGADRLCNAVAGYRKYGGPLIIIDFGTATTYDVIAANGDYLGGVIAPGIETSAADLHRRAAKLPKVELRLPPTVIGTDTASSMQSGILWGAVDAMEGMVRRVESELARRETKKPVVLATGGFSTFVSEQSDVIGHVEPSLVLDGIRLIFERNRRG